MVRRNEPVEVHAKEIIVQTNGKDKYERTIADVNNPPIIDAPTNPPADTERTINQCLVQSSSCRLQEIWAFGFLFLHQLIMVWLPPA